MNIRDPTGNSATRKVFKFIYKKGGLEETEKKPIYNFKQSLEHKWKPPCWGNFSLFPVALLYHLSQYVLHIDLYNNKLLFEGTVVYYGLP